MNRLKALLLCVLLSCAQDGEDGEDGMDAASVDIDELPSGSLDCPAGGVRIAIGRMVEVVCNGEDGPMGERGAQGPMGPGGRDGQAGAQGAAWVPQTITTCSALTRLPVSGVSANLVYHLVRFTDGSVIASCSASTTGVTSAGHAAVFAGWQQGAASGTCLVVSDASGAATSGWWRFEVVGGKPRATYNDTETVDDQAVYLFTEGDCPTATRPVQ